LSRRFRKKILEGLCFCLFTVFLPRPYCLLISELEKKYYNINMAHAHEWTLLLIDWFSSMHFFHKMGKKIWHNSEPWNAYVWPCSTHLRAPLQSFTCGLKCVQSKLYRPDFANSWFYYRLRTLYLCFFLLRICKYPDYYWDGLYSKDIFGEENFSIEMPSFPLI